MKHILFLNASADLYGSDRSLLRTVSQLDKRHFRARVIVPSHGPLVGELEALGVPVDVVNMAVLRKKHLNITGLFYLLFHFSRAYFNIKKLAKREGIHVIYANTSTVTVGGLVAASLGISYLTHIRETIEKPLLYKRILGAYIGKFSSRIIAVSEATRGAWLAFVKGKDIDVIPNGIESLSVQQADLRKELHLPPESLVVGTIARIHPQKGIDYFLSMAKNLLEGHPTIYFVLVGDHAEGYEKYAHQMQQYVEDNGLSNKVFFLGFKREPLGYLKAFDVFVLPSITPDSFPTVILEAFSQKVPVVATRQGGAEEMIEHGVNGLLVPLDNASEGAKQIYSLVTDENKRKEMSRLAFEKFQTHYTLEVYSKKINAYLHSL